MMKMRRMAASNMENCLVMCSFEVMILCMWYCCPSDIHGKRKQSYFFNRLLFCVCIAYTGIIYVENVRSMYMGHYLSNLMIMLVTVSS
jgi:hypothetical protein